MIMGRREQNKTLQGKWLVEKPASNRHQRRLLMKIARANNVDTSTWPDAPDHKDVIDAMRNMGIPEKTDDE